MNKIAIIRSFSNIEDDIIYQYEFDKRVSITAQVLSDKYSKKPIGFIGNKTIDYFIHLKAAHKAGNSFFNLNLSNPPEKQLAILNKLEISNLYVDNELMEYFSKLVELSPNLNRLLIDSTKPTEILDKNFNNHPHDIAYFISTSGTTGDSKIIAINNYQFDMALNNIQEIVKINEDDNFLHLSDMCFDVAIADLFLALNSKSTLIAVPREKLIYAPDLIEKYKITTWSTSPYLTKFIFSFRVHQIEKYSTLKKIIHCGEIFDASMELLWKKRLITATLFNLYGPAESTIAIMAYSKDIRNIAEETSLPLGQIFKNHNYKISETNELYISGPQVINSYFKSSLEILENNFYKTGDIVSQDKEGLIRFSGRSDDEIKIAGMRFNILEIEHLIKKIYPQHLFAIIAEETNILLIVNDADKDHITLSVIHSHLKKFIPEKFIPQKIVPLPELRLNSNGKLDRKFIKKNLI